MALMAWFFPAFSTQAVAVDDHNLDLDDRRDRLFPKKKLRAVGVEISTGEGGEGGGARRRAYTGFQMPLHYPRYTKEEYERMEEWKVDVLLREYGLACHGTLEEKRAFAIGAFLWPDQYN